MPWLSSSDVRQGAIAASTNRITQKAVSDTAISVVPAQSVVLVVWSGILRKFLPVAVTDRPAAINQDLRALAPGPSHDPRFVQQLLVAREGDVLQSCLKAGTTVESIDSAWFRSFEILLPTMEEQRAIAVVLSDMDAEIAALEARLSKARRLKRGMMQQLLTGKIRLPVADTPAPCAAMGD